MAHAASRAGTTDIVATPHANPRFPFFPEVIRARIAELQRAVGSIIRIHSGCDFHLSASNIDDALENPDKYSINHGDYVLVEFSDLLIPHTAGDIFDQMRDVGIVPIITHPERNTILQQKLDLIRGWVDSDCLLQVTAQSFLGRFGRSAKAFADTLVKEGLVHFVASDGHDTRHRPPTLDEAFQYVEREYGETCAEGMFVSNPTVALNGAWGRLADCRPVKKRWKFF